MRLMRTPKAVDILVTNHCNLSCSYCCHKTSPGETENELSTRDWLVFFSELNRHAVMDLVIQGGEPFTRKDLKALIEGIVNNRMRFSILSNGTLITDDMAGFIASTGRCNSIQISIDGSTAEIHDSCRGNGNFKRALEGIQTLRQHGIPVQVRATIHRHNVADLAGIAELLLEDMGLPGFATNAASYMGLCRQNSDDLLLTAADRTLAMRSLIKLNKRYNGRISAAAGPLREAAMWTEMERARKAGKASMPGRGYLKGCGGVMSKLGVRPDGVLVPCTQLSHIALGRINRDDLRQIWNNNPELHRLRNRRAIPLNEFDFCAECPYIPYCTGNCPAISYNLTGKADHPSPDACLKRFLEAGGRLPDDIC
jgi:SynChlorMet cassette radical SAM/SPASM protein ScmE